MDRKLLIGGLMAAMILLAGCTGAVEKSHDVVVYNPTTEVEASGENAVWTWSADIEPPDDGDMCDIKVNITLYNDTGDVIGTTEKVIKNVDSDENRRSVSYIGSPDTINSIVNYEVSVSEPQC